MGLIGTQTHGEILPADGAGPAQVASRSMADVIMGILESTPEEA